MSTNRYIERSKSFISAHVLSSSFGNARATAEVQTSLFKSSMGWTGRKYLSLLDLVSCLIWTLWTNIVASGVDSPCSFFPHDTRTMVLMRNSHPYNLEIFYLLTFVEHWASFFQKNFFSFASFHPYDTWSMWLDWISQLPLFLLHAHQCVLCIYHQV